MRGVVARWRWCRRRVTCRWSWQDRVTIATEDDDKIRSDVLAVDEYRAVQAFLSDFEFYVLAKLEAAFQKLQILDVRHYADTAEISAMLQTCGCAVLRRCIL